MRIFVRKNLESGYLTLVAQCERCLDVITLPSDFNVGTPLGAQAAALQDHVCLHEVVAVPR